MVELNQLVQLVTIAKCGTISRAAEELLISQPSLSRSMKRLEEEYGVLLFDHYVNKVVLNENGKLAVKHAQKIINDVSKMISDVQEFDKRHQVIHIACPTPPPLWDLESIIHKHYDYLEVNTHIDNDVSINDLINNKYQIIITPYPINHNDLECYEYLHEDLYISLPQDHPLSLKEEVTFKEIDGLTFILYSQIGFWYDLHTRTMPNSQYLIQNERSTFNEIVKASLIPSFTTNLSIKKEGTMKNRIIVPINDNDAHVQYYLTINKKDKNKYKDIIKEIK